VRPSVFFIETMSVARPPVCVLVQRFGRQSDRLAQLEISSKKLEKTTGKLEKLENVTATVGARTSNLDMSRNMLVWRRV